MSKVKLRFVVILPVILLFPVLGFAQQTQTEDEVTELMPVDTLHLPSISKTDSLLNKSETKLDSINQLPTNLTVKLDSLNPEHRIDRVNGKLDSVQRKLSAQIDSLTTFDLGAANLGASLDSLRLKLDSLKSFGPLKELKRGEERLAGLQSGVVSKVDNVEGKINEPLGKFAENGANVPGSVSLPGKEQLGVFPTTNLPGGELPQTGLDGLGANGNLSLNETMPDLPTDNLSLGGIDGKLPDLKTNMKGVGSVGKELKNYQGDLKQVGDLGDSEKLEKVAESKLKGMEGVSDLEGGQLDYIAMAKKWNADPEVAKEMAINKAKEEAVNHFTGHEEGLKEVMDKLSKLKTKQPDTEGVVDLFAKHHSSLKNKTFAEHLVPGVVLQINASPVWWFDFNPYLGYKLSDRFTTGLGWNERLAVNFKEWSTVAKDHIYGPRIFVEFKWKKNIHLKAETEWMNAYPKSTNLLQQIEPISRKWVNTTFVGIKNVFNMGESTKGQVQILYNLLDRKNQSPYVSKLNVRFGFEFPIRKKEKEVKEEE